MLLTEEEVANHPAGFGRSAPDPLIEPLYDKNFLNIFNSLKTLNFIYCC